MTLDELSSSLLVVGPTPGLLNWDRPFVAHAATIGHEALSASFEVHMIRNDSEYAEAKRRLDDESVRLGQHEAHLKTLGLDGASLERAMAPLRSFHLQLADELEAYERLKRGDTAALRNLHGLGELLVSLRIARGLTQRDLAQRLEVHESQVSRDERNAYHGVTVARASRVLDALGVEVITEVQGKVEPDSAA